VETPQVEETTQVEETAAAATDTGEQAAESQAETPQETPAETPAETPKVKARAGQRLVWKNTTDKNADGECESTGTRNGNVYNIVANDDGTFTAYHHVEGVNEDNPATIVENVRGAVAWRKCVDHHNVNYIAPAVQETPAEDGAENGSENAENPAADAE
jgi:hypothetical protein